MTLRDEATQLLQELIRLDTVNPPGNETQAAELLRDYLAGNGVESELYARTPERANLVARLPGRGDGKSLLLLSHTDTVVADASEWEVDPWSGEVRGSELWGRGALDMKGQVAAEAVAIASLAREGFEPAGDLVFAACADEEVGESYGLAWLCEHHPDAVRTDYALNEGAGERIELFGRTFYLCSSAEKMSSPFRLLVHGRAGHASVPGIADNALVKAAPLIERLAAYRPELRLGPGDDRDDRGRSRPGARAGRGARARARERPRRGRAARAAALADALADDDLCLRHAQRDPVPLRGGGRLPPAARADAGRGRARSSSTCSARASTTSSGSTAAAARAPSSGRRSGRRSRASSRGIEPEATVLPVCVAGFTDSHWLRDAFGTVAYGFFPMRTMDPQVAARLIHSADERIELDDLELAVDCFRHVAGEVTGGG